MWNRSGLQFPPRCSCINSIGLRFPSSCLEVVTSHFPLTETTEAAVKKREGKGLQVPLGVPGTGKGERLWGILSYSSAQVRETHKNLLSHQHRAPRAPSRRSLKYQGICHGGCELLPHLWMFWSRRIPEINP